MRQAREASAFKVGLCGLHGPQVQSWEGAELLQVSLHSMVSTNSPASPNHPSFAKELPTSKVAH